MGYYYFDSCSEGKVEDIGRLCVKEGMKEDVCRPPVRQWLSNSGKVCLVGYDPHYSAFPLLVQTWNEFDHKTPEVKYFLNEILKITHANQIYSAPVKNAKTKIDMALFR